MLSSIRIKGIAVIGGVAAAACSQAVIAFDNFGPGDTFDTTTGWTASGPNSQPGIAIQSACQFTAGATGMLDKITMAIGWVSGTNGVQVALLTDAGDKLGVALVDLGTPALPSFGNTYPPEVLVNPFNDPNLWPDLVLQQGEKYWIEVLPVAGDTWAAWNFNSVGDLGLATISEDGGSTYIYYPNEPRGALRIEVTSVPGPAAFAPFALGLMLLRRPRR